MQKKNRNDYAKNISLTVVGGVGLFIATMVMNSLFSIPPTRAEFDAHKADSARHLENINDKLSTLKSGQNRILEHLLNRSSQNEKQVIKASN